MADLETVGAVELQFRDFDRIRHVDDPLHKDLSAIARVGDTLFVACDETATLERLLLQPDGGFGDHETIALGDLLDLPAGPDGEMDIEGLAAEGGWLWVVGSHSLKRKKPDRDGNEAPEALDRMSRTERDPNRFFLGRFPLEEERPGVFRPVLAGPDRQAGWVKMSKTRSRLVKWLAGDPHIAAFLDLPSKENGLDVEGIAAKGDRIWLGLRGPVLRGHAVVLEMRMKLTGKRHLKPAKDSEGRRIRKHLLDTAGLGIRDLRLDGDDLLLLVGPTMALAGSSRVLRWTGATGDREPGVVAPDRVEMVTELPYELDTDHPEGLELWPEPHGALLVLYDSPGKDRADPDRHVVRADLLAPRQPRRRKRSG